MATQTTQTSTKAPSPTEPVKPRLLLVVPYFFPQNYGGVARLYDLLLSHMRGFDVTLLTDRRGGDPEAMRAFDEQAFAERGYRVRRMNAILLHFSGHSRAQNALEALRFMVRARREFRAHLRAVRPDVVVSGNSFACGWLFRRCVAGPLWVSHIHGEELTLPLEWGPIARWFRREQLEAFRRADLNLSVSRFSAETAAALCELPRERFGVIPCAVDTRRFAPPADREALRRELGWEGRTVLLTIARLVPRKGVDKVLEALRAARDLPPNLLYVIGGTGPQEAALRRMCTEMGLDGKVRFAGFIPDDDLPRYYGAADLFIQANREISGDTEGFGIVYLEANACGTPVIGGTAGGTGDAIADGVSGLRVDGDSVAAIREALEDLLGDPERRRRLGQGGYERIRRAFSVDVVVQTWERTLTEALAARKARRT